MKLTELKTIIREEIQKLYEVDAKILSNEFGGYDDSKFLKKIWYIEISELEKLLNQSMTDLKFLKANSKGIIGSFNRKDVQWVTGRIKYIQQVIKSKKKEPNFVPDHYRR